MDEKDKKKSNIKKVLLVIAGIAAIIGIVIGVKQATRAVILNKIENAIAVNDFAEANSLARRLNDEDVSYTVSVYEGLYLEQTDIVKALALYRSILDDYARGRIEIIKPYEKYAGEYRRRDGDWLNVRVAMCDGVPYYYIDKHGAKIGEPIKYSVYDYANTYKLDTENLIITHSIVAPVGNSAARGTYRYVSVKSPLYDTKEYRSLPDSYFFEEVKAHPTKKPEKETVSEPTTKSADKKHKITEYEPYDVKDYSSAQEFADDKYEEFYDYEDYDDEDEAYDAAEEYWEDYH